ncbi:MAG: PPOX class F420-dependent oxidoreductase [Anaerolineaceae bacterium]
MKNFEQFNQQKYLNLETLRKSGINVRTPVWFVQEGNTIFVRTLANSGKVNRIRNNGKVNIAVCKMDGSLLGDWVPATAKEVVDPETDKKVDRLLDKKYGLMKKMFSLSSGLQGKKNTILEIHTTE